MGRNQPAQRDADDMQSVQQFGENVNIETYTRRSHVQVDSNHVHEIQLWIRTSSNIPTQADD